MRRPRTLSSRLVITAVALVAVVSVLLGAATALAMRGYLTGQLDDEVRASLDRAQRSPDNPLLFHRGGDRQPPPDAPSGQRVGTVTAYFFDDYEPAGVGDLLAESDRRVEPEPLSQDVLDVLAEVPRDGEVHEEELPELGDYRLAAADDDLQVVSGLPTDDVDAAVGSLVRWELVLGLLGVLAAAVAGTIFVRRQVRPLREVAQTAHAVAALPLASGEIGVTERVPDHLTDERTEVGQVGAALNTLLEHVESSLDARHLSEQRVRQFVADASHELRTPLTTIMGYAELARRRPDDSEAAATALAKVEEESARMTALVEDLLLLARLDSGRPLAREPVDLTRLLVEAVSDARVVAPEHRWSLQLVDEPVVVPGDEHRLHQAVTNLLTNARKHTPAGTHVTVSVRPDGFTVHDDGPGFAPDLVAHAFERFARGDAARQRQGGVGLGLALVDAIVAAHGGSVTLRSAPGDTTIAVTLRATGTE
jgi:two-component system OmpR family sensor kinase